MFQKPKKQIKTKLDIVCKNSQTKANHQFEDKLNASIRNDPNLQKIKIVKNYFYKLDIEFLSTLFIKNTPFPWFQFLIRNPDFNLKRSTTMSSFVSFAFRYFLNNRKKDLSKIGELEDIFNWMYELKTSTKKRLQAHLLDIHQISDMVIYQNEYPNSIDLEETIAKVNENLEEIDEKFEKWIDQTKEILKVTSTSEIDNVINHSVLLFSKSQINQTLKLTTKNKVDLHQVEQLMMILGFRPLDDETADTSLYIDLNDDQNFIKKLLLRI